MPVERSSKAHALRARRGSLGSIEFLFRARTNLIELRVEPSEFRIQFNETQARDRNQLISSDTPEILTAVSFQVDTSGRLVRGRMSLQVQEIETQGFHDRVIIP
jgi:hypothetical protein